MANCLDCKCLISFSSLRCKKCESIRRIVPKKMCSKCGKILSGKMFTTCFGCIDHKLKGEKISRSLTGRKLSASHRLKNKLVNLGRKHSLETRKKLSRIRKEMGVVPPHPSGHDHPRWIKDRNSIIEKHRLRGTKKWREWRTLVFKRDGFICQECDKIGGYLEAHHIIPIRSERNELLFDLKNGITLCRPCHQKTIWKESLFQEKYSRTIMTRM